MIASPEKIAETGRATWADRRFGDDIWQRAQDLMALEAESGRTIKREIWPQLDRITILDAQGQPLCFLQLDDNGDEIVTGTSKSVRVPRAALITLQMILRGYLH